MPLKVTWWTASKWNQNVPGAVIYGESVAISGTHAESGVTPQNAVFASIRNTETGEVSFDYSGAASVANATPGSGNTSASIGAGERLWLDAAPGFKVSGITAA